MPAPKGNQYAKGNPSGKAGAPPKYDLEAEAKDLLEWSEGDTATSLYQFTNEKEYLASDLREFALRSEVFSVALKKAKERIGQRREEHCNDEMMNYGVWNRSARLYSTMLDEHEDDIEEKKHKRALDKIDYEIKKKNEVQSLVSEEVASQFKDLMDQITRMQKKS